jgi:multidrug efflux pump
MATVIIGGLIFASILTLILTPSILMVQANLGRWWQQRRGAAPDNGPQQADVAG